MTARSDDQHPRLPPPPFWRRDHFEMNRSRKGRDDIPDADILLTVRMPFRREAQPDGRIRHWRYCEPLRQWLRVVTLADGETVLTAFRDRRFKP